MRPLRELKYLRAVIGLASLLVPFVTVFAQPSVSADVRPGKGYEVDIVKKAGMRFAGLARDGEAVLVTDLAGGKLYRITADGQLTGFGPVLPHGTDVIGDPTGPYQIARHGDNYLVTEGWTPSGQEEGPYDHALLEVNESKVVGVLRDDFLNPYDFAVVGDALYVIDAAQNSIERLSADGSVKKTLFTFARLSQSQADLQKLSPTEFGSEGQYEIDAVPTGITVHGDRVYVSLFGGFPFLSGSGRIVSLPTIGDSPSIRIEAVNLNSPVDVTFDNEGQMLVLEHGIYSEADGFVSGSGRLLRVDRTTAQRETILEELTRPVAVLDTGRNKIIVSTLDGSLIFLKRTDN